MATPILNITEVANGQVDQYVVFNAALRALEAAANDFLAVDLTSGDVTLTTAEFRGYGIFKAENNTVLRVLTLPANKRRFMVHNSGTFSLDVTLGTTTIAVAVGVATMFYSDGTANGLVAAS